MHKLNQIISGEIVHNKHWQQLRKNLMDVMADPDFELSVSILLDRNKYVFDWKFFCIFFCFANYIISIKNILMLEILIYGVGN